MNLSKRFFIQNTLAILVTMLATALAVVIFIAVYTGIFGRDGGVTGVNQVLEARVGFKEIKQKVLSPDTRKNLDTGFQEMLVAGVTAISGDAIVLKDREAVFYTRKFSKMDMEKCIALSGMETDNEMLELDGKSYIFDRMEFKTGNGDNAVLILLAPIKTGGNFYLVLFAFTITFFTLTFIGMNLWFSIKLSKAVITPVSRLKDAACKISEGELDGEIAEEGEGEIRELCRTLEQMRLKLKESVYLQEKYDENRKFLVSCISHDLKTPVTSIKGYIEGIMDGVAKTPEKVNSYLETACTKAVLVNSMIDDLLLYSKLDLNQIPFTFERTDLVKYFEYCISDNKYEFEKAGIRLLLQNELKEAVFAVIDKERFKRAVQNILDNAKKYMQRPDGQVVVILRETRTSVIIEIKDNGRGIREEELPHIFDRFYRADASRKSTDGSGLGLAIAKQVVEGHDGRIWAISGPDKGTSIIISLRKC